MEKFRKIVTAKREELRHLFQHINRCDVIIMADYESSPISFKQRIGIMDHDPVLLATFLTEEAYNAYLLIRD